MVGETEMNEGYAKDGIHLSQAGYILWGEWN
jgi:lysophospholipase L1-like esterase